MVGPDTCFLTFFCCARELFLSKQEACYKEGLACDVQQRTQACAQVWQEEQSH